MKLNEYQKKAITTKIYDDSIAIPYIVLGISGESAELYEKIEQIINNDSEGSLDLLIKECGDVAWYLAAWADEHGLKLEDIEKLSTVNNYLDIGKLKSNLILFSGQIAEDCKKALRDNFEEIQIGIYPAKKMSTTNIAAANLLKTIRSICAYYLIDLEVCLEDNVEKLASRAKRGKLGGSGDVR